MKFRPSMAIAAALGLLGATAQAQHPMMGSNPIPNANNPLHQANGFGTGYNNPLHQANGFGTGYNNPLLQNGTISSAALTNGALGVSPYYPGLGYGVGVYNPMYQQGFGFGGWGYQGYGYNSGYNNPMNQGAMFGTNVNPWNANGMNQAGNGNVAAGPRENPSVSAALNGAIQNPRRAVRSKSSKSTKRPSRRR